MLIVETIRKVRQAHFRDGKRIREICREFNLARNTVRNIIRSGVTDQVYERVDQPRPKLGSILWGATAVCGIMCHMRTPACLLKFKQQNGRLPW